MAGAPNPPRKAHYNHIRRRQQMRKRLKDIAARHQNRPSEPLHLARHALSPHPRAK